MQQGNVVTKEITMLNKYIKYTTNKKRIVNRKHSFDKYFLNKNSFPFWPLLR